MASNYNKVIELLQKWPIDKSKGARDFGFYLRERAKSSFPSGGLFGQDEVEKKYQSLVRICDNKYGKMFPHQAKSSATGLTAEQCNKVLSKDFLDKYGSSLS